jgi:hypothetical protein
MATHFFHFEKRSVEFIGAGDHVHDGIVNAVKNVRVPHVGPRLVITSHHNRLSPRRTSIGNQNGTANRQGTQPKRYNVDEQTVGGLNFYPADSGSFWLPRKTSGVFQIPD